MAVSSSSAFEDMKWAIGVNRLSLKLSGTWYTAGITGWQDAVSKIQIQFFIVANLIFLLFPQAMALVRVWGHLLLVIDNLVASLLFVVIEFELITLWWKKKVLTTMMGFMESDWMRPKATHERDVMMRYGKLSRMITIGGYYITTSSILSFHGPVLFGFVLRTLSNLTDIGDRPFALQTVYFFDAYETPIYEIVVATQFIVAGIAGYYYTTVGTLFAAIVLHVSAQLENLAARIEKMGNYDDDDVVVDKDRFQIEFKSNTQEHQRLISFAKSVENTFSLMFLEVVIGFMLILCAQGYQIIVILTDDIERPFVQVYFCVSYMMYILFIMCVYSTVGDILVVQSEGIQDAAYNCLWYRLRYRDAAQLIPLLVRSQRPLEITAGKFVVIRLSTFAQLLKTTAGYVSFLLAVRES